jgi:hypothetical protein
LPSWSNAIWHRGTVLSGGVIAQSPDLPMIRLSLPQRTQIFGFFALT